MSSNRFRQIALGLPGVIEGSAAPMSGSPIPIPRPFKARSRALILHRINFCRGAALIF
jgi:hypothetical protein